MLLPRPLAVPGRWLRDRTIHTPTSLSAARHNLARNRPFHHTPQPFAARGIKRGHAPPRAPLMRKRVPATIGTMPLSEEGLMINSHLHDSDKEEAMARFEELGHMYWQQARADGLLAHNLTYNVFNHVGISLIDRAYSQVPSEMSIRSISKDVELVYRAGYVISRLHPPLFYWILASCTRAGSKSAILTAAANFLKTSASLDNLGVSILKDVKRFARTHKDPRAIVLYAMVLSRQERDAEALDLLRPVIFDCMYPSREMPSWDNDGLLRKAILSPWKVFIHSAQSIGDLDAAKEVERIAALEYHDPEALESYAYNVLEVNDDFEKYEQLMCEAATAGNANACVRLANFYYFLSLNLHPITLRDLDVDSEVEQPSVGKAAAAEGRFLEERNRVLKETQDKLFLSTISSLWSSMFSSTKSRVEYRMLASEWYHLAVNHGSGKACLLYARICHQEGRTADALALLVKAEEGEPFAPAAKKLRESWLYGKSPPKMPDSWLNV